MIKVPFGSVWWVKEQLWQEALPMHDPFSNRDGHPGLSVWRHQTPLPEYQRVPLMLGVSKHRGAKDPISFVLGDKKRPRGYRTWFVGKVGAIPARWFLTKAVRPYRGTRQLGEEDLKRLETWCRKKGL